MNGIGNGKFDPKGLITREQAATMLMRTAKAVHTVSKSSPMAFQDDWEFSSWAEDGINFVSANGVMGGTGNDSFSPKGYYTRQQAYVTFARLWKLLEVPVRMHSFDRKDYVDYSFGEYSNFLHWSNDVSPTVTYVNPDGTITVCMNNDSNSHIRIEEFDLQYNSTKTIMIKKELDVFGGFTKDIHGNYYVLFGESVKETEKGKHSIKLIKYNKNGSKQGEFLLANNDSFSFDFSSGTKLWD